MDMDTSFKIKALCKIYNPNYIWPKKYFDKSLLYLIDLSEDLCKYCKEFLDGSFWISMEDLISMGKL